MERGREGRRKGGEERRRGGREGLKESWRVVEDMGRMRKENGEGAGRKWD